MGKALDDIAAERTRQVRKEGWTLVHDDEHDKGELAAAAATYARAASYPGWARGGRTRNDKILSEYENLRFTELRQMWPWAWKWWKPTDPRRDLVKAGALIVAEIERLDRAAANSTSK